MTHAGIVSHLPIAPFGATRSYRLAGADPDADEIAAAWRPVTLDYLNTMGIELLRGRHFGAGDGAASVPVAIVDESIAGESIAGESGADRRDGGTPAVGARIEVAGESLLVVGIARTVLNPVYPGALRRTIYVPQSQAPTRSGYLVVRAADAPPDLGLRIHDAIWSVDPGIAIGATATVADLAADLRGPQRVMAVAISIFACIALAITMVSLYALVFHTVIRRQREFGIRLTLGAVPRQLVGHAVLHGMVWVAIGTGIGLLASAGLARLLRGLLYGIQPMDPVVFTLLPAGLLALALVAAYLPARHAARADPLVSLRRE